VRGFLLVSGHMESCNIVLYHNAPTAILLDGGDISDDDFCCLKASMKDVMSGCHPTESRELGSQGVLRAKNLCVTILFGWHIS